LGKKSKTLAAYTTSLGYFSESCSKIHVQDIGRTDLLQFSAFLRDEKDLAPRTCWNKFSNVMSFLKSQGVKGLAKKEDWPKFVETEPEVYEQEELDPFFAACESTEGMLFRFFLMTGFREQEVMYVTWKDVNRMGTVSVRHKPQYGWTPKAYKERSVPVPVAFIEGLIATKGSAKSTDLVFPAPEGGPDSHMLRTLKGIVTRAKLSPEEWWLHKFRATFATTCLQNGVDLRTVQSWLGHSDLASTMRYLRAARGSAVQAKVESIWNY
jgi:integrase/recombinase XerD